MMLATVSLTNWSRFGSNMILYRYGDDGDDVMYRHMMSQHKDQTEQRHGWMPWDSWGPEAWHRKASMSPFEFRVLVSALDHVNVENDNASSLVIALVRPLCSRIFDSERIMLTIHRLTSRFMHAGRINLLTDIFSQCLRHSPFPELRDALFMYGARLQRGMYDYLVFCSGCGLYEEVEYCFTDAYKNAYYNRDDDEDGGRRYEAPAAAIRAGDMRMLDILIEHGIYPYANDVLAAVDRDDCEMVEYLHKRCSTRWTIPLSQYTPPWWPYVPSRRMAITMVSLGYVANESAVVGAAIGDHVDVLQYLVDELHIPIPSHVFPAVSITYPNLNVLDYLFSKDASLSCRGSALLAAPYYARYFANIGADVNATDSHGRTLLSDVYASVNGKPRSYFDVYRHKELAVLIPILFGAGVDPEIVDHNGLKARDYADPDVINGDVDLDTTGLF